jgi:hypothetical protein
MSEDPNNPKNKMKSKLDHLKMVRRGQPPIAQQPAAPNSLNGQPMTDSQKSLLYIIGSAAKACNTPEAQIEFKQNRPDSIEALMNHPIIVNTINNCPQILHELNNVKGSDISLLLKSIDKSTQPPERHKDIDTLKTFAKHLEDDGSRKDTQ